MTSLKDLKDRTRSIKSTSKITQAMKLISASRYGKFSQQIKTADNYTAQLLESLKRVYYADKLIFKELKNSFTHKNGKDGVLLLVFGSDRGLCSTFNINIIKALKRKLLEYNKQKTAYKIVCYGKKVWQYVEKNYQIHLREGNPMASNKSVYTDAYSVTLQLATDLLNLLKTNQFSACDVIYTDYISALTMNVEVERILPTEKSMFTAGYDTDVYSFDNSLQDTFCNIVTQLFSAYFHKFYLNSITSEYASRMIAMDNATNNAKNLLVDLKMEYNRKRQTYITKELIEIITGAETVS